MPDQPTLSPDDVSVRPARPSEAPWTAPVFVIGCPRSGTTLLTLMLSSHPRLAIPPETRFLVPMWRQRLKFGDLRDEDNRARLAAELVARKGRKFNHLRLDRELVAKNVTEGNPTIGSASGNPAKTPRAPTTTASEVNPSVRACTPSATRAADPIARPVRTR